MIPTSLYVHVPFCKTICSYCAFFKVKENNKLIENYLNNLSKERKEYGTLKLKTLYLGGGTPSTLKIKDLKRLIDTINPTFFDDYEFTIELNPENIEKEYLLFLKKIGVNRLSIGIQTFDENYLKLMNRKIVDINSKIELAKKYFKNISVDLIYGVAPFEIFKNDLEKVKDLDINHLSLYAIEILPKTLFYIKDIKTYDTKEMYDYALTYLKEIGFIQYEISNFKKEGYESRHNLVYWRNEPYIGMGPGAAGYHDELRYVNSKNIYSWKKEELELIDEKAFNEYRLILGLRLMEGIEIENPEIFNDLIQKKVLIYKNERLSIAPAFLFVSNHVINIILERLENEDYNS